MFENYSDFKLAQYLKLFISTQFYVNMCFWTIAKCCIFLGGLGMRIPVQKWGMGAVFKMGPILIFFSMAKCPCLPNFMLLSQFARSIRKPAFICCTRNLTKYYISCGKNSFEELKYKTTCSKAKSHFSCIEKL